MRESVCRSGGASGTYRFSTRRVADLASLVAIAACLAGPPARAQQSTVVDPAAARIDPYVERPRVIVMTDIANEPDDQMSMVRFLVYANQYDIEGLVATTSTWMKNRVRPDVLEMLVTAYEGVRPSLLRHQPGFPAASCIRQRVR